jgi:hypothetical protein
MRTVLIAALLAGMLVVGLVVGAWADIPDNGGTKLYFCVYNEASPTPNKPWQVLDKSKGNCAPGWTEHAITVIPDP